jgi:hypothetical protein
MNRIGLGGHISGQTRLDAALGAETRVKLRQAQLDQAGEPRLKLSEISSTLRVVCYF